MSMTRASAPFPGPGGEHAVNVVECTIPPDVTIEQWRRLRRARVATRGHPWPPRLPAAGGVPGPGGRRGDHLPDTASRCDHTGRFEPPAATVHPLRRRAD